MIYHSFVGHRIIRLLLFLVNNFWNLFILYIIDYKHDNIEFLNIIIHYYILLYSHQIIKAILSLIKDSIIIHFTIIKPVSFFF